MATQYWNGGATMSGGPVEGGDGNWNNTTQNWTDATGATQQAWGGDAGVFSGMAGTVTVDAAISFQSLEFSTTGYIIELGSGTLTATGSGTITTDTGVMATISAAIAGTVGLVKAGTGTLTLSGANNYTGGTTISAGTLAGGAANAFSAASAVTLDGSSTLDLGGHNQTIASLADDGSGNAVVTNSGTGLAVLTAGGDDTSTAFSGSISDGAAGTVGLTETGTGTLTLSGINNYSGGTKITGGATLVAASTNTNIGSGEIAFDDGTLQTNNLVGNNIDVESGGGTITGYNGGDGPYVNGALTGTGQLTLSGYGLTFTGKGSGFTGSVDLDYAANVALSGGTAFEHAAVTMGTDSFLVVEDSNSPTTETVGSLTGVGTVSAYGELSPSTPVAATLDLGNSSSTTYSGTIVDYNESASGITAAGNSTLALDKMGAGTFTLANGASTYSGGTTITDGTLQLGAADTVTNGAVTSGAAGIGAITFSGGSGSTATLALETGAQPGSGGTFGSTLDDFNSASDSLDLEGFTFDSLDVAYTSDGTSLTVDGGTGGTQTETFMLTDGAMSYTAKKDSAGTGTLITAVPVCFAAGTLIRVLRDGAAIDLAVERLAVGDLAVTASGEARPIRWLGHRTIDCHAYPRPREVMPVRIAAHAFGENRPARDLDVSPGHAICLDFLGEVLIPAGTLVNGATITRHPVESVTYWHVELDSHDVLLAENLPAESFLDCGNRTGLIEQEGEFDRTAAPHTPADFCRPFVDKGVVVEAARERLVARAEAQGWHSTSDMDLHLVVDGERVEADIFDGVARFLFPATAREVVLASESVVPSDLADILDHRRIGVSVTRIEIEDGLTVLRTWAAGDPVLADIFHPEEAAGEAMHRFTDGRAVLPPALWDGCRGFVVLRIRFDPAGILRWLPPGQAEAGDRVALRVA